MSEKEFMRYLNAEKIAYYVYNNMIKNNLADEYVDYIGNAYASMIMFDEKEKIETYKETFFILEKFYNIDMLRLEFADENLKKNIKNSLNYYSVSKEII